MNNEEIEKMCEVKEGVDRECVAKMMQKRDKEKKKLEKIVKKTIHKEKVMRRIEAYLNILSILLIQSRETTRKQLDNVFWNYLERTIYKNKEIRKKFGLVMLEDDNKLNIIKKYEEGELSWKDILLRSNLFVDIKTYTEGIISNHSLGFKYSTFSLADLYNQVGPEVKEKLDIVKIFAPEIFYKKFHIVKMPFGLDLPVGATHGAGTVVLQGGIKMLQVPLWRSYFAGCILLGIAPCTAMVLVWGYLARGNDGLTLVMVAINSLTMLLLYGVLGGFLLGVGRLPVPWQALLLSISIYVALPLVTGYLSRKWVIAKKGREWFQEKFLHFLTPVTIAALLATLVLLFSFKGEVILDNPLTILWIAIPLFIQTNLVFWLGYGLAKLLKLSYRDAAPASMIGASNHFEVAIATSTMLFGLSSGAALATVVGVLIEVPVMLMLVRICLRTQSWFQTETATS